MTQLVGEVGLDESVGLLSMKLSKLCPTRFRRHDRVKLRGKLCTLWQRESTHQLILLCCETSLPLQLEQLGETIHQDLYAW